MRRNFVENLSPRRPGRGTRPRTHGPHDLKNPSCMSRISCFTFVRTAGTKGLSVLPCNNQRAPREHDKHAFPEDTLQIAVPVPTAFPAIPHVCRHTLLLNHLHVRTITLLPLRFCPPCFSASCSRENCQNGSPCHCLVSACIFPRKKRPPDTTKP